MVSSTHSCSGLSTPDLVCFYSTSGTPNMVFIAHLEYCVQNGRCWSALHTHYGVCCTLDVGLHTIHQSVLWTLQCMNTVHTRFYTKYSVQCTQKNCIIEMFVLQVTRMKWRPRNSCESTYNNCEHIGSTCPTQELFSLYGMFQLMNDVHGVCT